jgi:hypothetical protein
VTRNKRPLSVTILGCLYLAVGIIGFVYHGKESLSRSAFQSDVIWIELTEFAAIVSGAFILRGHNWARWLAVAWIAFHVIISAFNALPEFAIHCLFCAVIAWILFRPAAGQYFRSAQRLRVE